MRRLAQGLLTFALCLTIAGAPTVDNPDAARSTSAQGGQDAKGDG
eukprot:CAMPEP_0114152896 /NCGR_PEP_ID=MMETSP0043_2-20121206/24060_1 /TAXON_ID=464988 /ORGANISM="Hemiselmis andersenii, Strain CCMP644" /LENGTH=44 /DNA_ID= /DNA_START= /DNA_END= /DNA_ORIENTATION=